MPQDSLYPSIEIPDGDIWSLLFERKNRPFPDNKDIYIDNDSGRTYTYADTKRLAEDFGKGLKANWEWQRGDVLLMYTPNSIDTGPVTWGVHWAGGVVSPANPNYTVDELVYQLRDSGAKAIATQASLLDRATAAASAVGIPPERIVLLGDARDPTRAKHFTSVRLTGGSVRYRRTRAKSGDLAFLVYSSGTTGLPKGVMLSHRNIIANTLQLDASEGGNLSWDGSKGGQAPRADGSVAATSAAATSQGPRGGDTVLAFLPFFHIYGLNCCLHQALFAGWRLVVMPAFSIEAWCAAVQKHKATFCFVVPPVVLLLSKHPVVERFDLSSIRMLNSGAAPLTRDLVKAVWDRLGVPVKQGYGLSETSPTSHSQPWERWWSAVGSVGTMLPNMTAKYVAEDGETEVQPGQAGELWMKGPNVFLGYLNNEEGTKRALTDDGYFKTGDVGYVDAEGNFFITDRVKELIKYKGFQVPPAELEGLLVGHPAIDDAAVIGIYSEDQASELPRAYIVPKNGAQAGDKMAKEVADWIAAKVAPHKRLRGGVRLVDAIPKSASGKILRRVLKQQALEEEKKQGIKAKL